ncbi:MAG: OmpA family protein [Bacteroidales bacterium]|nr:OmpA family protein [Bacteroidales bacterium]
MKMNGCRLSITSYPKENQNVMRLLLFLTILLSLQMQGQVRQIELTSKSKKAISFYKQAENFYLNGNLEASLMKLEKAVAQDENFIEAWLLKADVEHESGLNQKAIETYKRVIAIDGEFFPMVYYLAGNLSLEEGYYNESIKYFETFLLHKTLRPDIQLQALDKLSRAKFGNEAINNPYGDSIMLLSDSINTSADEYINSIRYDNIQLLFTRRFLEDTMNRGDFLSEKFFLSNRIENNWQKAIELELDWVSDNQIGAMTLSPDGNSMYFAACGLADGFGSCDIYMSSFVDNSWSEPMNLGANVNSTGWDSQPCISADGSQLYFVSKRKGGYGGSDLWKSIRLQDGSWSEAINPGETLNSVGNEMAPYLHADRKTLYFSSTGLLGMGKADLFVSRLDSVGRWTKPRNLGYPVNTKEDEINILFNSDGNQAFISRNKKESITGFDIYSVLPDEMNKPEAVSFVKVIVRDSATNEFLSSGFQIIDLKTATEFVSGQTDTKSGSFLCALPDNNRYSLLIRKPGYCMHTEHFNLVKRADNRPLIIEIKLLPIRVGSKIVLNNVFFGVDKSELKSESFSELMQVVLFLQTNPGLSIELEGHTDSDGDELHNLKLSTDRAETVRNFLTDHGISQDRLTAKGYGSAMPVASNKDEEGKSRNRRTAFKIIRN